MKLLALDTSSTTCTVALLNRSRENGEQITSIHRIAEKQQGRLILPMIKELLETSHLSLNNLDGLVFGCGPGSYTGTRIASSVVQSIAYALNLAIFPISSMAALAQSVLLKENESKNLLVAIDAKMNQIYWGIYRANSAGYVELIGKEGVYNPKRIGEQKTLGDKPKIDHLEYILSKSKTEEWVGIGDGWAIYEEEISMMLGFKPKAIYPQQVLHACALLKLAQEQIMSRGVKPNEALPIYLC